MPFEMMDTRQVALYLHLDERKVSKLASRGKLPCQRRNGEFMFRKFEVDHWVEVQLHELPQHRLVQIEAGVRRHHGMADKGERLCDMIPHGGVETRLNSRTAQSVLRDLVDMADRRGLVYDRQELLQAVMDREQIGSTAIRPHVALPHPRHPVPYDISQSFMIIGRSEGGIPFSASHGKLTHLFFLVCCKDDRTHLHTLARLGHVLSLDGVIDQILDADDPDHLLDILIRAERRARADA